MVMPRNRVNVFHRHDLNLGCPALLPCIGQRQSTIATGRQDQITPFEPAGKPPRIEPGGSGLASGFLVAYETGSEQIATALEGA